MSISSISMMIFPVLLLLILMPTSTISLSPFDVFIDCGATVNSTINDINWVPDTYYISTGTSKSITETVLIPTLSTVRTFPLQDNVFKKFCYEIPADRTRKYLVRTSYYYGGVNGNFNPPVFDQIVDGTLWSVVNTTDDYVNGRLSYYEGVFMPTGKNLSVCLAANTYTDSDPFISSLEVVRLWDQLYNSTDFKAYSLSLVARNRFGYDGPMTGYPDDPFTRYWQPFGPNTDPNSISPNLIVSGIWNLPPQKIFETQLSNTPLEPLTLPWPLGSLPSTEYYIALYFANDHQSSVSGNSRILDIEINGVAYYRNLSVTAEGIVVFANQWPLSGQTNLTLTPSVGSNLGPLINGGEVFQVITAGVRTHTRDVVAMIDVRSSFRNFPPDWKGDPCLPRQYTWTGVTCSYGPRIRVVALNLTSIGLSGSISPRISRMTALTSVLLGNNSLWGTIPDLGSLNLLENLHLEDNLLTGIIPPSLENLPKLREVFLQNNNLTGHVPNNLSAKPGLTLRYTPGNPFLIPPQP